MSPEMKFKKFLSRFPELFLNKKFDLSLFKSVYTKVLVDDVCLLYYKDDIRDYVIASLLMKNNVYERTLIINAYRLLDVFLGNDEEYSSISEMNSKIIVIYFNGYEMENKRQADLLLQLMEKQRISGGKIWVVYRGLDIKSKYPCVVDYVKSTGLVESIKVEEEVEEI